MLGRVSCGAGVLIAEADVMVDEVADVLHPRPAGRRLSEQSPGLVRKKFGLTVAAGKQEQQALRGQVLDLVLQSVQVDRIRHSRITDDRVRAEGETARGCNEAAAPISETVAIAFYGNP